jgi:hypothetical protein
LRQGLIDDAAKKDVDRFLLRPEGFDTRCLGGVGNEIEGHGQPLGPVEGAINVSVKVILRDIARRFRGSLL